MNVTSSRNIDTYEYLFGNGDISKDNTSNIENTNRINELLNKKDLEIKILEQAFEVFEEMKKSPNLCCRPDKIAYTALIKGCFTLGYVKKAKEIFQEMQNSADVNCHPNTITYNTIINGCCKKDLIQTAYELFNQMKQVDGGHPNAITYSILIQAYLNKNEHAKAKSLLDEAEKSSDENCRPNAWVYNHFIKFHCDHDEIDLARAILMEMEERKSYVKNQDEVPYQILIQAYCKQHRIEEAQNLFDYVYQKNEFPIKVCGHTLVDYIVKNGVHTKDTMDKARAICKQANIVLEENLKNSGKVDVHGYKEGSAFIAIDTFLKKHPGVNQLHIITGKGLHSKSKNHSFLTLRSYVKKMLEDFYPNSRVEICSQNMGELIFHRYGRKKSLYSVC